MAAAILQSGCSMMCPHGGTVTASPSQSKVSLGGSPALLATDVTTVAGCPLNVSGAPQPCLTVQWTMPATKVTISGTPPLLTTSIGLCLGPTSAPQGTVSIVSSQTKVQAT